MKINLSITLATLLTLPVIATAHTPSGYWELAQETPDVKDYFFRINVDPGETYPNIAGDKTAPSSVYYAQYVTFQGADGGYLGLQRSGGQKRALVSLWTGDHPEDAQYFNAKSGVLIKEENCNEYGGCSSIKGPYAWKVGHQYRFRYEKSPTLTANVGAWWQISLTDLTINRTDVLGQLQTPPRFGNLRKSNALFLEYFWGPYRCDTLRHANTTYYQILGNWGKTKTLNAKNGNSYGGVQDCPSDLLLPNATPETLGSSSFIDANNAVQAIGNQYRGVQKWDASVTFARQGIMYASDPTYKLPVIWQAKRTGKLSAFPAVGQSNNDWRYIGLGYPIINDLYLSNRSLYTWDKRNDAEVILGDYFVYNNPHTHDIEYFRLKRKPAGYFPIDKSDNQDWEYVGRHFIKDEPLKAESYYVWGNNNRYGKVGQVFDSGNKLYRLKTPAQYWYFPANGETENTWWELIGYKH